MGVDDYSFNANSGPAKKVFSYENMLDSIPSTFVFPTSPRNKEWMQEKSTTNADAYARLKAWLSERQNI